MNWTITDKRSLTQCLYWLEEFSLIHAPLTVTAEQEEENRSAKQNRLLWLWNTEIGNHLGMGKDEVHDMLKEKFAVPIFTRDSKSYAEMVESVKNVRRAGMTKDADQLKKQIVKLTSTADFSVKQMTEYLHSMELFAGNVGATITFPEDIYNSAMGRCRKGKNENT